MKKILIGTALILGAASIPALAQTTAPSAQPNASSQRNDPGTGGRSKAGVPGQPGNKSGPSDKSSTNGAASGEEGSMTPDQGAAPDDQSSMNPDQGAAGSDNSKVPGLPGNKSGPAQKPNK